MIKTKFGFIAAVAIIAYSSAAHSQDISSNNSSEAFKPSGTLLTQFFGDYYYQLKADTVPSLAGQGYYEPKGIVNNQYYQAFDIRRLFLGYDYRFARNITGEILLAYENGSPTSGDVVLDGNHALYLRWANLQFSDWVPMSRVTFGQQSTAAFTLSEAVWSYRSIEKTIMEFHGMAQAGDLGIQSAGRFDKDTLSGYSVMISDGNGAKTETDKYKKFAGELNTKLFDKKIILEVYGDYMDMANYKDSTHNFARNNTTLKAFAAYSSSPVTIGVEYATQNLVGQSKSVIGDDALVTALSLFARGYILPKQLNWFARYDIYDPNSKANNNSSGRKESFITAGLDWLPDPTVNMHVQPNVWIETFGDKSPSNLNYEGMTVARLTFAYKY